MIESKEPKKQEAKMVKKYGAAKEEKMETPSGGYKAGMKVLKKKAIEGSAAEEKGESASYEKTEDQKK
jgi:hypothetical protein